MQPISESDDQARYSRISPAAVIALVLGLASPLAFVGPLFYLVPIAALGAAALAVGQIRRSGGTVTGQRLARLGMALGLACLAGALVRQSVRDSLLQQQASAVAIRWLNLLADGRLQEAAQLLSGDGSSMLLPPPEMGQEPLPPEQVKELLIANLRSQVLARAVAGQDDPATVDSADRPVFDGPRTIVAVQLTVDDAAEGGHRHARIQLVRARHYEGQGEPWRIDRWDAGQAHPDH